MVVAGLNSRSRYWTPCLSRASRMLNSVRASAKGSPWPRAKRARTSSKVVMGDLACHEIMCDGEAQARERQSGAKRLEETRECSPKRAARLRQTRHKEDCLAT